jgi:hypothetical protein
MRVKTNKDLVINGNNIPEGSTGEVRGFIRTDDLEFYNVMFDFGELPINFEDAERTRE